MVSFVKGEVHVEMLSSFHVCLGVNICGSLGVPNLTLGAARRMSTQGLGV